MSLKPFIDDITAFVNHYDISVAWKVTPKCAVLEFDRVNKKICFVSRSGEPALALCDTTIFEEHWQKNKDAVKSRLASLLGVTRRIFARSCKIQRITKTVAKVFVDENHLMGYAQSYFNYGLFQRDELLAVACFSKGRKMDRLPGDKRSFELVRFCNLNYCTVVGGLSKLIRHFEEEQTPGDIMTYIDKQWGEPRSYLNLGFKVQAVADEKVQHSTLSTVARPENHKLIKHLP
jgi:hypothetical protein